MSDSEPIARAGDRTRWPWPAVTATGAWIAAVTLAYAILAWDRRWITDDALIVVRTVREILAGHGPLYSPFERAEPTTSTIWMWLLAGCGWITGANVARLALALGGLLSVGGLALALDATRRFWRAGGHRETLVPAGALVLVAVFPFWDFATSGLETGLCQCWLAAIWWLLVTLRPDGGRRLYLAAVIIGLGPLVRPDFAIATFVFLLAAWHLVRPPWRRALALAGCAVALPLAYEVFRAGYYGTLVPLPALAKSASGSQWASGARYALRFVKPHLLYVPLAALAVAAAQHRGVLQRRVALLAAPIATAVLHAVFVIRVGGDFMHGRMLLPATLLCIAPLLVIPVRRAAAPVLLVLGAWTLFVAIRAFTRDKPVPSDERAGYQRYTHQRNPTTEADYIAVMPGVAAQITAAIRDGRRRVFNDGPGDLAMSPAYQVPAILVAGRLGLGGALVPLDAIVVDSFGLANPLGARITRTLPGHIAHEKLLPQAWVLADFADPSATDGTPAAEIAAARHAMTCGDLAELLASVRAPLTAARFWANLTGSLRRTLLVIPANPVEAERQLCR